MENSPQVGRRLLAAALAAILAACQGAPSPYASWRGQPLAPLRADSALFAAPDGRVLLRLPYRASHGASASDPPYLFLDTLDCGNFQYCAVAQWLDVPTFRRVPGTANYWADKRAIYAAPYLPLPGLPLFFELGPVGQVRFSPGDPDTARIGRRRLYRGVDVGPDGKRRP